MGNKSDKEFIIQKPKGKPLKGEIKEELDDYLTTLTQLAKKGSRAVSFDDIPRMRCNSEGASTSRRSHAARDAVKDRRERFKRSRAFSECHPSQFDMMEPRDIENIPSLLDQDDGGDWEEMREWLVWCMDVNLKEHPSMQRKETANQDSLESNVET